MQRILKCSRQAALAALTAVAALLIPLRSQAVSLRQLVEIADISGVVVSPDGRRVAFRLDRASIERNMCDTVWYVQDLDTDAPPHRIADGGAQLHDISGGALPAVAHWSPDGRSIFYRAQLDGKLDVWRAAADGSGAQPLTLDSADVRDFRLSDDGATLQYSVGAARSNIIQAEQDEYDHGIRVDATVPIGQGAFRSGYDAGRFFTRRFIGVGFGRDGLLADVADRWKTLDLKTGSRSEDILPTVAGHSNRPEHGPAPFVSAFDAQSRRTVVLTRIDATGASDSASDTILSVHPFRNEAGVVECRASQCTNAEITSAQWRPGRPEVVFTTSDLGEGRAQSIFRWNIETGVVLPVARDSGLINGGRKLSSPCGISVDVLVCVAAEAARPPRVERIDIDTGVRHVLFAPNEGLESDLARSVSSRFLRWEDASGKVFTGHLFTGNGGSGSARPLFVTYYNCSGFLRGGVGDEWPLASFAQTGISALCINARPHQPDPVARYDEGVSAVESIAARLAREGEIDPARIGMGGLSFGSEVTLWAVMQTNLLSAASITSPVMSPLYYLMNSLQGARFFAGLHDAWGLGSPDATPGQWQRLSPVFNLERIHSPVLMQMPEEEYLYGLDYIIPMMRDKKADLYLFPNEPHQKFQPRHKHAAYERNLDWFRFWLQGHEDPDPAKQGQYAHWREMRDALVKKL